MHVNVWIEIVSFVPNDHSAIVVAAEDGSMKHVLLVAADDPVHHLGMIWMHVEVETVVVMQHVDQTSVTIAVEAN